MTKFDNHETQKIDCQTIRAPQYGIDRDHPINLRKKFPRPLGNPEVKGIFDE
jgi:hypothetical protein